MKTWKLEFGVVALVLFSSLVLQNRFAPVDIVASLAVLMTFGHAQVSDRMAWKQSHLVKPDVECYRWSMGYFLAKEVFWLAFFLMNHSYPALLGVGIFLFYPIWRKVYREHAIWN